MGSFIDKLIQSTTDNIMTKVASKTSDHKIKMIDYKNDIQLIAFDKHFYEYKLNNNEVYCGY